MRQTACMERPAASTIADLAGLLVLGTATGCRRHRADPLADCRALIDLPHRDPATDADAAFARHDVRVLMLGGFSASAPGVDYYPVALSAKEIGKVDRFNAGRPYIGGRLLPGTSDTETEACSALRPGARHYVIAYNRRMLTHLPAPPS
jgi:hypothetical protein